MAAELPDIQRVEGRLKKLTAKSLYKRGNAYSFDVDGQSMWFLTNERSWNPTSPFLAEGDRVELAVLDTPLTPTGERWVYALRNLEDDGVYIAHFAWQGTSEPYAATRIPPGSEHRYVLALTALLMAILGMGACMGAVTGTATNSESWLFLGGLCVGAWLLFAVPLYITRWRWKAGFPTRRQRVTEAVYRCLDLGSPLAPNRPVRAV
ncbi:hypothetical protein [Pseudomonas batumici]|uniref:Uncharacterized protein n=1 Tax=Pseudomonas batumici TaxID=226910 RepID=A0A0C2I4K1_9PSED|nr:hypothetical protein [Pseudomonas batumici]KIH84126.1 hypothetical protein UCMB321_2126 [Pseudomonas batumici]